MKKNILLFILIFCLSINAYAGNEKDILSQQNEALDLSNLQSKLPRSVSDIFDDSGHLGADQAEIALGDILGSAGEQAGGLIKSAVRSAAVILTLVVLFAVASTVFDAGNLPDFIPVAGALAVTAAAAGELNTLIGLGSQTIMNLESFSKALLPTLAAAASAAGSPAASAARHLAAMLFSDVLLTVINRFLVPLTYAYIAMCAADAAVGNDMLSRAAALVKGIIIWVLTGIMTVFVAYITLSGSISASADAITIKGAKLALSGTVPVVGSIISDAAETVVASAAILKNVIGIAGLLSVLALCILPFLRLGAQYLVYKTTAALCSVFAGKRLSSLIDGIAGAFGIILGMTGACAVLVLISIASALLAAGGT